jgi:squalene-hopene/tetraprenyl-beta-curcumene cyclase
MLSYFGYTRGSHCVERAVRFLREEQEPDGSWFGRWGVNYVYGTWQVLKGLYAIGEDMSQEYVQRAARWLRAKQRPDGGWGETCLSYDEPSERGDGPSTPSQTAWGVMGLLSAGDRSSESLRAGVGYLLEHQNQAGDWDEEAFTGTGFPRVFYLRYRYYGKYFPLFALGMYRELAGGDR